MTYGCGKSDSAILAGKPTNKAEQSAAESVERRVEAKGNTGQQSTYRAQDRESVSQALDRIRQVARHRKKEKFTALFHHITVQLLQEAFFELKENARRISSTGSKICTHDSSGERIGRCRAGEGTYPSRTGSCARSRLPP